MRVLTTFLRRFSKAESGVMALEYGLLVGLLGTLIMGPLVTLESQFSAKFENIATSLRGQPAMVKRSDINRGMSARARGAYSWRSSAGTVDRAHLAGSSWKKSPPTESHRYSSESFQHAVSSPRIRLNVENQLGRNHQVFSATGNDVAPFNFAKKDDVSADDKGSLSGWKVSDETKVWISLSIGCLLIIVLAVFIGRGWAAFALKREVDAWNSTRCLKQDKIGNGHQMSNLNQAA